MSSVEPVISIVGVTKRFDAVTALDNVSVDILPGTRIHVERGSHPLRVARLQEQPFTSRLVKKFDLNIDGFRSKGRP